MMRSSLLVWSHWCWRSLNSSSSSSQLSATTPQSWTMLYSIAQTDADLAAVFSKWHTSTTEHRMHYDTAHTKISFNSGVDQGCPLSTSGFSAAVDPVLRSVMAQLCTHYGSGAKLFAYLDDWYLWIKPQCLLQTIAVITAATRSVNLALQSSKTQVWKGSCQDPVPAEFQDKVTHTQLSGWTSSNSWRHRTQPCCSGRADLHGENNTTLLENCHHTCRRQC